MSEMEWPSLFGDALYDSGIGIVPSRLKAARERRGWTAKELALSVGVTPSAVSLWESQGRIAHAAFIRLITVLDLHPKYLLKSASPTHLIDFDRCHFRSRRSASQRERRASVRKGELVLELASHLEGKGVGFPTSSLRHFADQLPHEYSTSSVEDGSDLRYIEQVAEALRRYWGIGYGPIPHLIHRLEAHGVFVFVLDSEYQDVDAFSVWAGDRGCVFVAQNKSATRARFDAAHELGHLVLHDEAEPASGVVERQADRFAGAFLAPRPTFDRVCPRTYSYESFLKLKKQWGMSVAALVHRAYDIGKLSESAYRRAYTDLNRRGVRVQESEGEPEMEKPFVLSEALRLLGEGAVREAAEDLCVYPHEIDRVLKINVVRSHEPAIRRSSSHWGGEEGVA